MKGFLEGIESNWHSPGLKGRFVEFERPPTRGLAFMCNSLITSEVLRVTHVENEIRFMTRNTTYILTMNDAQKR